MNKREFLEIIAFPPFHFFFAIILSLIPLVIKSVVLINIFPFNLFGIVLIISGISIFSYYSWIFKRFNTTLKFEAANKLYIGGLFKYSRNPMYLGGLITLVGISLMIGSLFSLIGPLWFFITMNFLAIPLEEKMMQEKFPDQYPKYKSKVRRWI